ncbi:hypothetical protein PYW07_010802 [Mythimna separata]|uniref:Reverse transcriptase domain-containing protein n=1 Tax=Mythimna separata TaxID=271217 RepID=A0AAD7Y8A7_MYTSE|nr:hypothetical protein PYW07_010802 [Mythimna separata]
MRNKLRPWAPLLTQSLRPQAVEGVVANLFPERGEHSPPLTAPPPAVPVADHTSDDEDDAPEVTEVEMRAVVRRLSVKNTASGPDGVPGRVWILAMEALGSRLRGLFSACMERGQFRLRWKNGKLVLIAKPGRPADSPSAYRLVGHLARVGLDLAHGQFGFRRGRSTVDAITRVRALTTGDAVIRGRVVLAVSLDIANAFSSGVATGRHFGSMTCPPTSSCDRGIPVG